ncbi:MAG: 3-oxoacyl-ACP synthase [Flavobacteriales bacterium]|nr:ketoacyl-ACP synthase III [Flavobacteriaceae bacterium]PHX92101.1 MAG: 3-oxoacyl-ACP synthase [Flavobacteriales bacterium]
MKIRAAITGIGGYVPSSVLSNSDLEKMVDTNDEWIRNRTGIVERRILDIPGKATSDLAVGAILPMLTQKGIDPSEIELIICATVTGDYIFPATANIIAEKIGAVNAWGYDIGAACSGFLFAVVTGSKFIESGAHKKVLVVGADKMSAITDYTDRNTCILFGDGAGCVLLEPTNDDEGIMDTITRVDGSGKDFLIQKAGGSMLPPSHETIDNRLHSVYQEGKTVFKFAVTKMADVSFEIMERNKLSADDIAWLVPHQANMRIINATAERMGIDKSKVMINIHKYGNTTSATLPLCLWEWENQLKKGDNIILSCFGGGFTWGSIYIKWSYDSN